jgi:hypothetical protein
VVLAPRVINVVTGVCLRDGTALKLDKFFSALEQLGSQAAINEAITTIIQGQEGACILPPVYA